MLDKNPHPDPSMDSLLKAIQEVHEEQGIQKHIVVVDLATGQVELITSKVV